MLNPDTGGRDELSRQLRALREAAGPDGTKMVQTDAAQRSGISQSMITRIERGQRVPRPTQVRALCDAYGAPNKVREHLTALAEDLRPRVHRVVLSRDYASVQKRIGRIEAASAVIRGFTSVIPPGLLQSRRFVEVLFGGDEGAEERLANQALLHDPARQVEYLFTEGALGVTVLAPDDAVEQMQHLIELSLRSNVRIGVIPWGVALPTVPVNTWESYDERAVITGTMTGSATIVDSPDVDEYLDAYHQLSMVALWDEEARALLTRALERYRVMA
jgi:transcriptional regulator with XRE-family HTH domain